MNDPQQAAAAAAGVIAGVTAFCIITLLQGWALIAILGWLNTGISLSLFQAAVISVFLRSVLT
jgi:hypothetical protein